MYLLTSLIDTEQYLFQLLDLSSIKTYSLLSKAHLALTKKTKIYQLLYSLKGDIEYGIQFRYFRFNEKSDFIIFFDWFIKSGTKFKLLEQVLIEAASVNYVPIFSHIKLQSTHLIVDILFNATKNNSFDILNWFFYSIQDKPYPLIKKAIEYAAKLGKNKIIEWWLSKYPNNDKLFDSVMDNICIDYDDDEGHYICDHSKRVEMLEWCINFPYNFSYTEKSMDTDSECGNIDALNWWLANAICKPAEQGPWLTNAIHKPAEQGPWLANATRKPVFKLKYSETSMDGASAKGHIHILQWWLDSKLELKYSEKAILGASLRRHIHILQWWLDSNFELKYTNYAIDWATGDKDIAILQWWLDSRLKLKYTTHAMDHACVEVLDWFYKSNLELRYSKISIDRACDACNYDVLDWWVSHSNLGNQSDTRNGVSHSNLGNQCDNRNGVSHSNLGNQSDTRNGVSYSNLGNHSDNRNEVNHRPPLELKYTEKPLYNAFKYENYGILQWWIQSGLEFQELALKLFEMARCDKNFDYINKKHYNYVLDECEELEELVDSARSF